jgi:hypothetical protein
MKVVITTDITLEPVTLEEVKEALKISGSGHDTELERLITDCRMFIEKAIDTSVSEREIEVTSDTELEEWELPLGPVSNLVESTDSDDNYVYSYTGGNTDCPADIKRLITDRIEYVYDKCENEALAKSIMTQIQLLTRQPAF